MNYGSFLSGELQKQAFKIGYPTLMAAGGVSGGIGGALLGTAGGAIFSPDNIGQWALGGAGIGAGLGALGGANMARQYNKLLKSVGDISPAQEAEYARMFDEAYANAMRSAGH